MSKERINKIATDLLTTMPWAQHSGADLEKDDKGKGKGKDNKSKILDSVQAKEQAMKFLKLDNPTDKKLEQIAKKMKLNDESYKLIESEIYKLLHDMINERPKEKMAIWHFFGKNSAPTDEEFHAFAKKIGLDHEKAEDIAFQLAHDLMKDKPSK